MVVVPEWVFATVRLMWVPSAIDQLPEATVSWFAVSRPTVIVLPMAFDANSVVLPTRILLLAPMDRLAVVVVAARFRFWSYKSAGPQVTKFWFAPKGKAAELGAGNDPDEMPAEVQGVRLPLFVV